MPRLALLGLLAATACAPSVRITTLNPVRTPARAPDQPITLYEAALPRCPIEELALVQVESGPFGAEPKALTEKLRSTARELGGDAVVRVVAGKTAESIKPTNSRADIEYQPFLSGTVVRFRTPTCRD